MGHIVPHPWQLLSLFSFQSNGIFWFSWAVFTADGADCGRHQTESDEGLRLFSLSLVEPENYFRKASWIVTMHGEIHYVRCKWSKQLTYFHIHKKLLTTEMLMNRVERSITLLWAGSSYPLTWLFADLDAWNSWMSPNSVTILTFGLCGRSQTSGTVSQAAGGGWSCFLLLQSLNRTSGSPSHQLPSSQLQRSSDTLLKPLEWFFLLFLTWFGKAQRCRWVCCVHTANDRGLWVSRALREDKTASGNIRGLFCKSRAPVDLCCVGAMQAWGLTVAPSKVVHRHICIQWGQA